MSDFNDWLKAIGIGLLLLILAILCCRPVQAGEVELEWLAVQNCDNYRIHYGEAADDKIFSINTGLATTWTIPNLDCGKEYFFEVRAYNSSGKSDPTQTVRAEMSACPPPLTLPEGWTVNGVWIVPEP